MEYLTQEGFKSVLEMWAEADPNIQSFGWGQLYDEAGKPHVEQKYPAIFVQPQSTNVNENVITRTYQILFYDAVFVNEAEWYSNLSKVISDCEEISLRFIRFLKAADEVFYPQLGSVINPFYDRFFDDVSGVILNITIEFNGVNNDCQDPLYVFDITKNNY